MEEIENDDSQKEKEGERAENERKEKDENEARKLREELERKKDDQMNEMKLTAYIKGKINDITSINLGRIIKEIGEKLTKDANITKVRDSLKVVCKCLEDQNNIMEMKILMGQTLCVTEPYGVTSNKTNLNNRNRGIIFRVNPDISDEEMSKFIGMKAERIIRKIGANSIRTEQMILYSETALLKSYTTDG